MLVTLIGKKSINRIVLPKVAIGNYWLIDKNSEDERKLVNIEGRDGEWQIISNSYFKIINPRAYTKEYSEPKVVEKIILKEYSMYYVTIGSTEEWFILYCAPVFESNFIHLDIKRSVEILIGSGMQNDIIYNNALVEEEHVKIYYNNGRWTLENFDTNFSTFINNKPVQENAQILFNGDVIFIMGLKIIILGRSIFINNPLGRVTYNNKIFEINKEKMDFSNLKPEEDIEQELYSEKDYFARAPRLTSIIECEKVKIDSPPAVQSKEGMPLILVLGSTLTMGLMMMVSVIQTVDGLINGTATAKETAFALTMSLAMLITMTLFPILNVKYDKKQKKKYEEKRQNRYKEYIKSKANQIEQIMDTQRKILFDNYLSARECTEIILNRTSRLWERKIEEHDFLTVRVGIGNVDLDIDIEYPEEQFAMEDDNLVEILSEIGNKSKILEGAPITISLAQKNVSALVVQDNEELIQKFMQNLIMQLIAFQSYEDLKLVFLLKEDKQKKWEYIKMLPHIWNSTRQIRFFTDEYSEMKEISRYLEEDLKARKEYDESADYKSFSPYYLIVTDDYKKIENLKIITEVLKSKVNLGFSILCITNNLMELPNECKTFISINNDVGTIFESEMSLNNQKQFMFDSSRNILF